MSTSAGTPPITGTQGNKPIDAGTFALSAIGNEVIRGISPLTDEVKNLIRLLAQREVREMSAGSSRSGSVVSDAVLEMQRQEQLRLTGSVQTPPATPGGQMIALGPGITMTATPPGGVGVSSGLIGLPAPEQGQPLQLGAPMTRQTASGQTIDNIGQGGYDVQQLQPFTNVLQMGQVQINANFPLPPEIAEVIAATSRGEYSLDQTSTALIEYSVQALQDNPTFNPAVVISRIQDIYSAQSQALAARGFEQQWFQNFMRAFFIAMHAAQQNMQVRPITDAIRDLSDAIVAANTSRVVVNPGQPPPPVNVDFTNTDAILTAILDRVSRREGMPVNIVDRSLPITVPVGRDGNPISLPVDLGFAYYEIPGTTNKVLAVYNDPRFPVSIQNAPGTSLQARVGRYSTGGFLGVALEPGSEITATMQLPPGVNALPVEIAGGVSLQGANINVLPQEVEDTIVRLGDYLNPYNRLTDDQLKNKFVEMGYAHYQDLVASNKALALKRLNIIEEMQGYSQNILNFQRGRTLFSEQGFEPRSFDVYVKDGKKTKKGVPLEQTYKYIPEKIPESHVKFSNGKYVLTQGGKKFQANKFSEIEKFALKGGDYNEEIQVFRNIRHRILHDELPAPVIFKARKY